MPRTAASWRHTKRAKADIDGYASADPAEIEMETFFTDALTLKLGGNTFNMDSTEDKAELARQCWKANSLVDDQSLSVANVELTAVLKAITAHAYQSRSGEEFDVKLDFRVEGLLANLQRMQSQKQITLLTAMMSVGAYRAQVPRELWYLFTFVAWFARKSPMDRKLH